MPKDTSCDQRPIQTTTRIAHTFGQMSDLFRAEAESRGLRLTSKEDGITLHAVYGDVHVVRERRGVQLTLSASDKSKLYLLREAVDERLDKAGGDARRLWSLTEPGAYPPNLAFAAVESCERISPSYFRVTLRGPALERFSRDGLHFRLLFEPEAYKDQWPRMAQNGRTQWPGGMAAWHRPVYTTRRADPASGRLVFDVFIHEGGRVTEWCRNVNPGDKIALTGPGGEWIPESEWIAMFGDETALPAIARILEAMPRTTEGCATIMVSHKDDIQEIDGPAGVKIRWLIRGEDETLHSVLNRTELPGSNRLVWFSSERSEVLAAREAFAGRGLDKAEFRAAVFWSRTPPN